ncbi:MAG: glycosyltransferase family 39 protein [Tepidisphaeraceae bacterium]
MPIERRLGAGLLLAWLLAGGFLLFAASQPPVSRTQEARVLETAREMAELPVNDWGIPRLNGAERLRKPPLAYWLSASSFRLFGVSDFTGRLPVTLLAWLTLGSTFLVARQLYDGRTAFFAAAVLLSSWLGMKSAIVAETDGLVAAFLTLGVFAVLRAFDARPGRDVIWQHLGAVCCALTVLAKGPPAIYLVIFMTGLCAIRQDWRPMSRFFRTGAVTTLLVIAVPWFVYVARHSTQEGQLGTDLLNSAEGGDHHGPPWDYLPMLLQATLPWTGVWLAALWSALFAMWRQWQTRGPRVGRSGLFVVSIWALSMLVPLCCWGNKQLQYLVPVMPPTAILVGWALTGVIGKRAWATAVTVATFITAGILVVIGLASIAVTLAVRSQASGSLTGGDAALVTAIFGLAVWTALRWRAGRRHGVTASLVLAAGVMLIPLAWLPNATGGRGRNAAIEVVTEYPHASFYFRGTELPVMSWTMRRAVPLLPEDKIESKTAEPNSVILEQQQDDEPYPTAPKGFRRDQEIRQRENVLHVYVPEKKSEG